MLRYGIKDKEGSGHNNETIWLIDWENPDNNDFAIAEEVSIEGENKKHPEIVLYINGTAVGVIELEFGAISFEQEVPILAKTMEGATVSGIIDCLVEVPRGYIIIDHKTDEDCSDKAFNHHVKQLAAYAKFLQLDKPVVGIGVNWVRRGSLGILSI